MDLPQSLVLAGGGLLIGAILWYFFSTREAVRAGVTEAGLQHIKVMAKGGYSPDAIVVKQGTSVRLDFCRDETAACSEQVLFRDFDIARELPAFKTSAVEFLPDKSGEFTFTCSMNMMRAKLIVEPV